MIKKCFAKVNLSLDILKKRADGYHDIDTIMARISLYDKLEIKKTGTGEFEYQSNIDLGHLTDNLIYKAYKKLAALAYEKGLDLGIAVRLKKNIPLAAGLAGGSTDCAETIKALNELWDLGLSKKEMAELGKSLGADIPFFFEESLVRAEGIGEIITPFTNNLKMKLLLINDGTEIASSYVYKRTKTYGHIDNEAIIAGLEKGKSEIIDSFENVMEAVVLRDFPHLNTIKENLLASSASKALVSGSGATVFGIFFDDKALDKAYENLKDFYNFVEKVDLIDD
ncbi:4-(cytidine 5'-diphospho)-2-C-methyl-D-erythritol kinase [uncultured Anaerococcus sp.]|uniref:4-(cytidine 5'-diphospho)-2-C-methyl-D-erythritol kinase n=1 Tax=uncultured Anaerococcus sp. TaxID=293428 RepID=UPI00260F7C41|nr:4-(cytidine 5'-diphospho)-2-C-methyl-D-erythritol kinase [uncultured Anaerococcus sp.]